MKHTKGERHVRRHSARQVFTLQWKSHLAKELDGNHSAGGDVCGMRCGG